MPVNLVAPVAADLHPIAGVRIGVAEAGVRKANRKDLTVFLLDAGASVAGVFTQNRFCAAPVQISRDHLASGQPIRAMLINTGNANAGTGADGLLLAGGGCSAAAMLPLLRLALFPPGVVVLYVAARGAWTHRTGANVLLCGAVALSFPMAFHDLAMQRYLISI
eukprot:gene12866-16385_t